jgi:hypothetical protein
MDVLRGRAREALASPLTPENLALHKKKVCGQPCTKVSKFELRFCNSKIYYFTFSKRVHYPHLGFFLSSKKDLMLYLILIFKILSQALNCFIKFLLDADIMDLRGPRRSQKGLVEQ